MRRFGSLVGCLNYLAHEVMYLNAVLCGHTQKDMIAELLTPVLEFAKPRLMQTGTLDKQQDTKEKNDSTYVQHRSLHWWNNKQEKRYSRLAGRRYVQVAMQILQLQS